MIARNPDGSISVNIVLALAGMVVTLVLSIVAGTWIVSSSFAELRDASDAKYATKGQVEQLTLDVREVRADVKELLGRVPKAK
jgi:hypothetical protein